MSQNIGTKQEVFEGKAIKTKGGLVLDDLVKRKRDGKIISKAKQEIGRKCGFQKNCNKINIKKETPDKKSNKKQPLKKETPDKKQLSEIVTEWNNQDGKLMYTLTTTEYPGEEYSDTVLKKGETLLRWLLARTKNGKETHEWVKEEIQKHIDSSKTIEEGIEKLIKCKKLFEGYGIVDLASYKKWVLKNDPDTVLGNEQKIKAGERYVALNDCPRPSAKKAIATIAATSVAAAAATATAGAKSKLRRNTKQYTQIENSGIYAFLESLQK